MSDLKLVHSTEMPLACLDEVGEFALDRRVLRSEAVALAALIGPNPYSNYMIKHGVRPDRAVAATIGSLMGTQVKAADGSLQPARSAAARGALRESRRRRKIEQRKRTQIDRLCAALGDLAANEDDPTTVMDLLSDLDESEITKNLGKSLEWLQRFAEEWHGRVEKQKADRGS